jgi:hypothetical protein
MRVLEIFVLAISDGTPKKAILTAVVVGTILLIINQGDLLIAGIMPPLYKVCLTYCVPYLVTTWGALTVKLDRAKGTSQN